MHHDTKACEDDRWSAHCSDDITWHNSQRHTVTVEDNGVDKYPFDKNPIPVPAHGTAQCNILPGLPPGTYTYEVEGCPLEATPRTVIIS
jgi:hypothetical protein